MPSGGCFKHFSEPLGSLKVGQFLDQPRDYQLITVILCILFIFLALHWLSMCLSRIQILFYLQDLSCVPVGTYLCMAETHYVMFILLQDAIPRHVRLLTFADTVLQLASLPSLSV